MSGRTITLAYSPDADDAFMFWALMQGKVDTGIYTFAHHREDTDALNRRAATSSGPDVCAVSIHQYAYLGDHYLLLPHGGSVGRGYGPVLAALRPRESWKGARIGVPGLRTTAYLVLRLLLSDFEPVVVPVSPFDAAFDALDRGDIDAALLIHEGRLLCSQRGLVIAVELGEAWLERTGLPLPLGGNVIRRDLGADVVRDVSRLLKQSIRWALDHREAVIEELIASESRASVPKDHDLFDRYLAMYANRDTLDYGEDGRRAIEVLLRSGYEAKIISHPPTVEFAE
jgi:1,4-dihydroxy-6-naphthoate synthase